MHWLITLGIWVYIAAMSLLGLGAAIVAFGGFYIGVNALIDRYQGTVRRKRGMATPCTVDELRARRRLKDALYKECQRRAETMKFARKL